MKIKSLISLIFLFFMMIPVFAQKETMNVSSFTRISFGISGELRLKQGEGQKLELQGNKDDLEKIETEVVNGQLRIKTKNNGWWDNLGDVTVYITVPQIEEVSLGGSGKIYGEGPIKSGDLKLSVSGSGRMELEASADDTKLSVSGSGNMVLKLNAKSIDEDISGSGGITLSGTTGDVELSISGSGKLEAADMQARSYNISISGSGKSNIAVSDAITSTISGSGSVYYKGSPDKVISKVSGSGRVKKID
jgi:hypothetical protein